MSPSSSTPDEIAAEAARAAREAAEEATEPEAKFFLRQHAIMLERIAASYRRAGEVSSNATRNGLALVPLLADLPL
jgi:hypothetical protein